MFESTRPGSRTTLPMIRIDLLLSFLLLAYVTASSDQSHFRKSSAELVKLLFYNEPPNEDIATMRLQYLQFLAKEAPEERAYYISKALDLLPRITWEHYSNNHDAYAMESDNNSSNIKSPDPSRYYKNWSVQDDTTKLLESQGFNEVLVEFMDEVTLQKFPFVPPGKTKDSSTEGSVTKISSLRLLMMKRFGNTPQGKDRSILIGMLQHLFEQKFIPYPDNVFDVREFFVPMLKANWQLFKYLRDGTNLHKYAMKLKDYVKAITRKNIEPDFTVAFLHAYIDPSVWNGIFDFQLQKHPKDAIKAWYIYYSSGLKDIIEHMCTHFLPLIDGGEFSIEDIFAPLMANPQWVNSTCLNNLEWMAVNPETMYTLSVCLLKLQLNPLNGYFYTPKCIAQAIKEVYKTNPLEAHSYVQLFANYLKINKFEFEDNTVFIVWKPTFIDVHGLTFNASTERLNENSSSTSQTATKFITLSKDVMKMITIEPLPLNKAFQQASTVWNKAWILLSRLISEDCVKHRIFGIKSQQSWAAALFFKKDLSSINYLLDGYEVTICNEDSNLLLDVLQDCGFESVFEHSSTSFVTEILYQADDFRVHTDYFRNILSILWNYDEPANSDANSLLLALLPKRVSTLLTIFRETRDPLILIKKYPQVDVLWLLKNQCNNEQLLAAFAEDVSIENMCDYYKKNLYSYSGSVSQSCFEFFQIVRKVVDEGIVPTPLLQVMECSPDLREFLTKRKSLQAVRDSILNAKYKVDLMKAYKSASEVVSIYELFFMFAKGGLNPMYNERMIKIIDKHMTLDALSMELTKTDFYLYPEEFLKLSTSDRNFSKFFYWMPTSVQLEVFRHNFFEKNVTLECGPNVIDMFCIKYLSDPDQLLALFKQKPDQMSFIFNSTFIIDHYHAWSEELINSLVSHRGAISMMNRFDFSKATPIMKATLASAIVSRHYSFYVLDNYSPMMASLTTDLSLVKKYLQVALKDRDGTTLMADMDVRFPVNLENFVKIELWDKFETLLNSLRLCADNKQDSIVIKMTHNGKSLESPFYITAMDSKSVTLRLYRWAKHITNNLHFVFSDSKQVIDGNTEYGSLKVLEIELVKTLPVDYLGFFNSFGIEMPADLLTTDPLWQ